MALITSSMPHAKNAFIFIIWRYRLMQAGLFQLNRNRHFLPMASPEYVLREIPFLNEIAISARGIMVLIDDSAKV